MSEIDKKICREVRAELARRGLTFTKVAEILGVTLSSVTNQMNGRHFGRKNAEKWAEAFGFSATFLMTGEGALVPGELEAPTAPASPSAGGVFIPTETLELYNSMAESIRNLTELLKMRGGVSSFVYDEKNIYHRNEKK